MFTVPKKLKVTAYALIAIGLISIIAGFVTDSTRAWSSLHANNFFFLAISLAAVFFYAIQYVGQAGWSVLILRPMMAMTRYLPFAGAVMIFIILMGGLHKHHIYHWMDTFISQEEVTVAELEHYESTMTHHGSEHGDAHGDSHGNDHSNEHATVEGDSHAEGHEEGHVDASHESDAHHADSHGEAASPDAVVKNPHYDEIIAGKTPYLNFPFFLVRALIYLLGWIFMSRLLRSASLREDIEGGDRYHRQSIKLSAIFLVFFAVTSSMSAWDWIMSIDTHWFSTLFGWYVFAGMFVSGLTTLVLILVYLKSKGYLQEVNENHLHDLGKFMFAFSIFWTYLWFSQYMLIWYSDIPEEVTYYIARFQYYKVPYLIMLALNFLFPVVILISRDAKRFHAGLIAGGIFILIGHWLDVIMMIYPGTLGQHWSLGWIEVGGMLGFAGLFILVVFTALSKAALLPKNHPMLKESKIHHI